MAQHNDRDWGFAPDQDGQTAAVGAPHQGRAEVTRKVKRALITAGGTELSLGGRGRESGFDPYNHQSANDVWNHKRRRA